MSTAVAVVLTRNPTGPVSVDEFAVDSIQPRDPADGEALVEVHALSLDPYQRIALRGLPVGSAPPAAFVGRVVESRSDAVSAGAWVIGDGSWASYLTLPAAGLRQVNVDADLPAHLYLGVLGLSGITGYLATRRVGAVRAGEVVVVTGALGGVGQVAAQVAIADGATVVSVVGGRDKYSRLDGLGIKALDYRDSTWLAKLDEWAPEGVDVLIDSVWSETSARVFERLRPGGRMVVCGQISGVEKTAVPPMPVDDWFRIVSKSLTIRGFRAVEYANEHAAGRDALGDLIRSGKLVPTVHIVKGLDQAPKAFVDMMNGRASGKVIITVRET